MAASGGLCNGSEKSFSGSLSSLRAGRAFDLTLRLAGHPPLHADGIELTSHDLIEALLPLAALVRVESLGRLWR